jgi:hypothetical protein
MTIAGHLLIFICLSSFYIGCSNSGSGNKAAANQEQIVLTDSILLYFQQERFDKIVDHFDENMKLGLNKEQLAVVWAQLNAQFGKYAKSEFYSADKISDAADRIVYRCDFGSQKLYFQVVFGKDNRVSGIYFKPQPN